MRYVAGALVVIVGALGWVWLEAEHELGLAEDRISAMCGLKAVIALEGPTDLEAFIVAQAFPHVCGPDPYAHPTTPIAVAERSEA